MMLQPTDVMTAIINVVPLSNEIHCVDVEESEGEIEGNIEELLGRRVVVIMMATTVLFVTVLMRVMVLSSFVSTWAVSSMLIFDRALKLRQRGRGRN
jgi:hypothetical protein